MPLAEIERLFVILRGQIILNELFIGVFSTKHAPHPDGLDDAEVDADLDLMREATSFPVTVRVTGGAIEAAFPLPHHTAGFDAPTVVLAFTPNPTSSLGSFAVSWTAEGSLSDGQKAALDEATSTSPASTSSTGLVNVVKRIDDGLRQAMS